MRKFIFLVMVVFSDLNKIISIVATLNQILLGLSHLVTREMSKLIFLFISFSYLLS